MTNKYLIILFVLITTSCSESFYNTDSKRVKFEKYLQSFVNNDPKEIIYEFGQPDKYINNEDNDEKAAGTYMVYNLDYSFSGAKYTCKIRFKISQKTQRVIEWDYAGNGCY